MEVTLKVNQAENQKYFVIYEVRVVKRDGETITYDRYLKEMRLKRVLILFIRIFGLCMKLSLFVNSGFGVNQPTIILNLKSVEILHNYILFCCVLTAYIQVILRRFTEILLTSTRVFRYPLNFSSRLLRSYILITI